MDKASVLQHKQEVEGRTEEAWYSWSCRFQFISQPGILWEAQGQVGKGKEEGEETPELEGSISTLAASL